MNTITVICAVAARFNGPDGQVYSIDKSKLGCILTNVPAWVQDTLMFRLLEKDGSIHYITSQNKKQAENEPMLGLGADGKKIEPKTEEKPVEPEAEEKVETKPAKRGGRKSSKAEKEPEA